MIEVINKGPPTDGGYPDSDLHQVSGDGSPVGPDPAWWPNPEWRDDPDGLEMCEPDWMDNLGEMDTFDDEVRMGFPAGDAAPGGAMPPAAANMRPVAPVARSPVSQGLHPDDSAPVSGGRFYLRLIIAAAVIIGGMVLLVWYTNR